MKDPVFNQQKSVFQGTQMTSRNIPKSGHVQAKWVFGTCFFGCFFSPQAALKHSLQPPPPSASLLSKVESHFKSKGVQKRSTSSPKSKQAEEKLLNATAWSKCIFNSFFPRYAVCRGHNWKNKTTPKPTPLPLPDSKKTTSNCISLLWQLSSRIRRHSCVSALPTKQTLLCYHLTNLLSCSGISKISFERGTSPGTRAQQSLGRCRWRARADILTCGYPGADRGAWRWMGGFPLTCSCLQPSTIPFASCPKMLRGAAVHY